MTYTLPPSVTRDRPGDDTLNTWLQPPESPVSGHHPRIVCVWPRVRVMRQQPGDESLIARTEPGRDPGTR